MLETKIKKDPAHVKWENEMYEKYPVLFREHTLTRIDSCMGDGICVQPGWYSLVERLCESLKDITAKTGMLIVAEQVKQKLGGMRFYVKPIRPDGTDEHMYNLFKKTMYDAISNIERESEHTCEACGKTGKRITIDGYIYTLCPRHALMLGHTNEENEKEKTI